MVKSTADAPSAPVLGADGLPSPARKGFLGVQERRLPSWSSGGCPVVS